MKKGWLFSPQPGSGSLAVLRGGCRCLPGGWKANEHRDSRHREHVKSTFWRV